MKFHIYANVVNEIVERGDGEHQVLNRHDREHLMEAIDSLREVTPYHSFIELGFNKMPWGFRGDGLIVTQNSDFYSLSTQDNLKDVINHLKQDLAGQMVDWKRTQSIA